MRLNTAKVKLCVNFKTDGDFSFRNADNLFNTNDPLYDGADIYYGSTQKSESYTFFLDAVGDENACNYAVRDLLEALVCNLSTSRSYIIRDVYQMLIPAIEQCLWSKKEIGDYSGSIGGNYEGTYISLKIVRSEGGVLS